MLLYLLSIKIAKLICNKKAANIAIKNLFINKLAKCAKKLIFNIFYH